MRSSRVPPFLLVAPFSDLLLGRKTGTIQTCASLQPTCSPEHTGTIDTGNHTVFKEVYHGLSTGRTHLGSVQL